MANKTKYLYLPLEIFDRELNGMLLFSLVAAEKGWRVYIGGKKTLFPIIGDLPAGIVVLKSVVPGEVEIQEKIKGSGHKVTSIDAEGLIPSNGKSGVELRYSRETIEKSDRLFLWGQDQFQQVKNYFPGIVEKGVVTGSPIFDYWRLLKLSNQGMSRVSRKTVLIATSFPYANHVIDSQQAYEAVRAASGENASEAHIEEIFLDGELQEVVYPLYIEMVQDLAKKLRDYRIILRPHPAENPAVWSKVAARHDNVELQYGGEISTWLLKCDCFVHFNSTTSIEACFYDKKVITLIPDLEDKLAARLSEYPLLASQVCHTSAEVVRAILRSSDSPVTNSRLNLNRIIEDSDSERITCSSANIVRYLEELGPPGDVSRKMPSRFKILFSPSAYKTRIKLRIIWLLGWIDYLTGLFNGRYVSMRHFYRYGKTKQGRLSQAQLITKVNLFCDALQLERGSICVRRIKAGLFVIHS